MAGTGARARIDAVRTAGIPVTDQDRAVSFCVENLGFEVRLDAAAAHAELRARGVDTDDELLFVPIPMFAFRDQDGNRSGDRPAARRRLQVPEAPETARS
jgi:hypothetical protein